MSSAQSDAKYENKKLGKYSVCTICYKKYLILLIGVESDKILVSLEFWILSTAYALLSAQSDAKCEDKVLDICGMWLCSIQKV